MSSVDGSRKTARGGSSQPSISPVRLLGEFFGKDAGAQTWLGRQLAIESDARSGFHVIPLGMIFGILAIYEFGWRPLTPTVVVLAIVAAAMLAASTVAGKAIQTVLVLIALAMAGASLSILELSRNTTVVFSGETTVTITGRVLWRDQDDRGRWRYRLAITATERPELTRPPTQAEIIVSSLHAPIPIGRRFGGLVRLRAPSGPAYPGSYDFAFGAFFGGLGAYGYALGPPKQVSEATAQNDPSLGERLVRLRLVMSDRIRSVIGGAEGAVASAIITGERTGVPKDVNEWLRTTGLSHVLSISGLHMALVAGFAMTLLRTVFAAVPGIALVFPAKKIAALGALCVAAFYLALSGFDTATTRSFVMIAIMLFAIVLDRSALTLRNVAIAAVIVLAMTPHALLTASFQLSFAATAAIVAAYGAFARWRRRGERPNAVTGRSYLSIVLVSLAGIAATSLVAGTATAPFAAFHFQRVAPFGLLANMIALPIFSVWIMPLALLAVLAMPFGFDTPFLWLLGQGMTLVFVIAHWLHDRLPDDPTGSITTVGLVLLTLGLIAGCFLASALRLVAIPMALAGLLLARSSASPPELLVFEDGKEVALVGSDRRLVSLKARPNGFVFEQWRRGFPERSAKADAASTSAFTCERTQDPLERVRAEANSGPVQSKLGPRSMKYCHARTRSGLKVVWTDDYRAAGRACDEGDIAIVARAIRLETCRSGVRLVTLRTLRRTGSLSIARNTDGSVAVRNAIEAPSEEWNSHRLAPWPETWRKTKSGEATPSSEASDTSLSKQTTPYGNPQPQ